MIMNYLRSRQLTQPMEDHEVMYLPLARGNPPSANMEGVMMFIRLPEGKAVCVSSYWDEKECGGHTATALFYADTRYAGGSCTSLGTGSGPEVQGREHIGLVGRAAKWVAIYDVHQWLVH